MPTLAQQVQVSDDWQTDESDTKPPSLIVQQRRVAHVLPWFRFVCAEGDDSRVIVLFASHLLTIEGHGLSALLPAIAAMRVVRLIQPTQNEAKFGVRGDNTDLYRGPAITNMTVQQVEN